MTTKIIYPGTFDPITNGHVDLIKRSLYIFDQVIVAVAADTQKTTLFSLGKRIELAATVLADIPNATVMSFKGLLVNFAKQQNAKAVLRGLRVVSDFEYEFQMAGINRHLNPEIETIFMTPSEKHTYVSSSLIKEIATLGGDITEFVHPVVARALIDI